MNLTLIGDISPFDSIRHYNENGNEFWLARELMVLMGYKQWRSFKQAIETIDRLLEAEPEVQWMFRTIIYES